MSNWDMMIPLMVFTRIKQGFPKTVRDKLGMTDKNFSTVGSSDTPAVFPFVYAQTLPGAEQGIDMQGKSVNAGLFAFQIDVYSNKSQSEARTVMTEIRNIMKEMGFECNQMPSFEYTKDVHRMTARFRRLIASGDKL